MQQDKPVNNPGSDYHRKAPDSAFNSKIPSGDTTVFLDLYRHMITAREVDRLEEQITGRGEAFFHVSGAGHEAVCALNPHLTAADWLHCHYRDKSLMLARGISTEMFFHSLFCKDASHSRGRQMSAHLSDRDLNILSLVGPVGNNALQAAGIATEIRDQSEKPIVLCAMGDGTTQQGEVLEAIAEAVRWELPVLFLIEDNHFAISTSTGKKTFYDRPDQKAESFYGIPITWMNGRDTVSCHANFGEIVSRMREDRKPAIAVFEVDRLSNHTNADDQRMYRSDEEIMRVRAESDPISILRKQLLEAGQTEDSLQELEHIIRREVGEAARNSQYSADPEPVYDAKRPLPEALLAADNEYSGNSTDDKQLTMLEAIRDLFRERMAVDNRICLYGEDLEDPKGDVFGLTRGLTQAYPGRVRNSPLTESTIVGVSAGRALAGGRPVAFLQFADFLPLALNQIISEIGSMYWRTDGAWECPVIIMLTCGGYRPGLGPFHAQTMEALAAHTPGVDVYMPASAGDAVGLLNAAFESERPTLFFYPKSCLNDRSATTSTDVMKQLVPPGKARFERNGRDITFVAWGNTVSRCKQAADVLEREGIQSTLIDLRSISPWDKEAVLNSVKKTGKVVIAHEDNHTCGMGGEILATILEETETVIQAKRVTRSDTYVPCNFSNQLDVLPSFKRILEAACELLELEVNWIKPAAPEVGKLVIEAVGTSPSDESITISEWYVEAGQMVATGDLLAAFEADKAAAELLSPSDGEVDTILVEEEETVKVGTPVLSLKIAEDNLPAPKPVSQEEPGTPELRRKGIRADSQILDNTQTTLVQNRMIQAGIAGVASALGSKIVSNEAVLAVIEGKEPQDIVRTTGIESRFRIDPEKNETALSLGTTAARKILQESATGIESIDMIICTTGTPGDITPSLACRILHELGGNTTECQAFDLSAACSGYVYALQIAYDFIQSRPDARILVITSEVLTPLLDDKDFNTAIIFGDGATASLIVGEVHIDSIKAFINRPALSAKGEPGTALKVPAAGNGYISMNGSKVFAEGVRKMIQMLKRTCARNNLNPKDLDLVIPHQANQRIMDAIGNRLELSENQVFSNIANHGNTSSCTIPICLEQALPKAESGQVWGLTAFGGGFTYGACILKIK